MNTCKCVTPDVNNVGTDNVNYSGSYLSYLDVNTGDSMTSILQKIDAAFSVLPDTNYEFIKAGNVTMTGNGILKSFTFNHNLGATPDGVVVVASSSNNVHNFKTEYNATTVTVTYSIAPANGDQISWSYVAVKNKQ